MTDPSLPMHAVLLPPSAKTAHGKRRLDYLPEREGAKYANEPYKVRRGHPGDKLRRKAFERKL